MLATVADDGEVVFEAKEMEEEGAAHKMCIMMEMNTLQTTLGDENNST